MEEKGVCLKRVQSIDEAIHAICFKISKPFKTAFASAIIFGMIAHFYMFMNKLPNYDDMALNGFGATFRLGRWFLWVLGAAAYHLDFVYSLPWMNGLVTLVLIALSAGLLADIFAVKSTAGNGIIGAAMAVYPSWTATFFFMFTAPYYAAALFLAVCSVYMTIKAKRYFVPASLMLACSMGIYQAYMPFAATVYVMIIILLVVEGKRDCLEIIRTSFYYLGQLILGSVFYLIITKISLVLTKQELTEYKGVNEIGRFSLSHFSQFVTGIFNDFFGMACNNNLELSYNAVTKWMYLFVFVLTCMLVFFLGRLFFRQHKYLKAVQLAVMMVIFAVAVNSIYLVSSDVYSLMRYSYVSVMILPVCLLDRYKRQGSSNLVLRAEWVMVIVLAAGIMSYCHFANAQYLSMDLGFEQASGYYGTIITQIKSLEDYNPQMKIALVGHDKIEDESLYRNQVMEVFEMSGRDTVMAQAYSIEYFLKYYCGFDTELVNVDAEDEEIAQMPVYPQEGSIEIIDNIVVVKFSDEM